MIQIKNLVDVTSCQPKGEAETIYLSSRTALISSWNNVGVAGILSIQEKARKPAKTAADYNMWGPKVTVQIAYKNNSGMCHVTYTWGTLESVEQPAEIDGENIRLLIRRPSNRFLHKEANLPNVQMNNINVITSEG